MVPSSRMRGPSNNAVSALALTETDASRAASIGRHPSAPGSRGSSVPTPANSPTLDSPVAVARSGSTALPHSAGVIGSRASDAPVNAPSSRARARWSTAGPGRMLATIAIPRRSAMPTGAACSGERSIPASRLISAVRRRVRKRITPHSSSLGVRRWRIAAAASPLVRSRNFGWTRMRRGRGCLRNSPARKRLKLSARSPALSRARSRVIACRRTAARSRNERAPGRTPSKRPRLPPFACWRPVLVIFASDLSPHSTRPRSVLRRGVEGAP